MKRIILTLITVVFAVRLASASDIFSYTATATPGSAPDGTDQNNNPVSVWTVAQNPGVTGGGNSGDYFGTAFGGETLSGWEIWSSPGALPAGDAGFIEASNFFAGGPLTAGQTISINFEMRAADAGRDVGVKLLNASGDAITFGIFGGEPNATFPYTGSGYFYSDAGSSYASAGPMGYQYQSEFNISFTITGANTYTAAAGSDTWSGTFSGQLVGIDVFNYGAGNGSDLAFNNLTVAPELAINNISLNDSTALFNATNTLSFTVNSPSSPVVGSGIQLILNGSNVSSGLVFTGNGTENVTVSYTNLQLNQNYSGEILVTNEASEGTTAPLLFDTFSTNFFTWEAEDFDFNGGQFIDNPALSLTSPDSYYDTTGVTNVDEYVPNFNPTNQPHLWRTNDEVSIALAGDTARAQFVASGIPDYLIGYFNPGNWVDYTRTYPAGTYNVYARIANGNGGLANCTLAEVTSGQGTTNQTLTQLGMFQFTARGWNSFNFVPLTDPSGNLLAVKLNGQTTLRVTSGNLGGGVNVNFFMLAPGTNTPPAITSVYPDGLQPFETTNRLVFGINSQLSTVSQNNIQVTLNGVNVSSQLNLNGTPTNWSASLPLPQQAYYSLVITATDAAGHSNTYTETFDNFSQNNMMVEADEYDFNGGQFIDDSIQTATNYYATNSYFPWPNFADDGPANVGVYGIDYTTANTNSGEQFLYRYDDGAGTQPSTDFLRNKFYNSGQDAAAGEPEGYTNDDFNIGWWNPGTWLNYTRTFQTNNYYVYGRLAGGVPYVGTTLSLVTFGQGSMNQTTQLLGSFSDPNANGFQSWHWVPLQNNGTNVICSLAGIETLKATAGPGAAAGNVNAHYYLFVAVVSTFPTFPLNVSVSAGVISIKFQSQNQHSYTVQYSGSLNPVNWQTLTTVNGDGTVKTVTDTVSGPQRFYRIEAQ
jgi:hypothetical protein